MMLTSIYDHLCYCASNLAYLVEELMQFPPERYPHKYANNPYYTFLKQNGLQHVQPFANDQGVILDRINAAIVLEFPGYNLLAFRGTLSPACKIPAIQDWIQDLCVTPKAVPGYPGTVHAGIFDGYETIREQIFDYLSYLNSQSEKYLWITGHSKGGPMATYGVWDAFHRGFKIGYIVTFASPRPGSQDFADAYEIALKDNRLYQTRYENDLDIVPFLPPDETTAAELSFAAGVIAAGLEYYHEATLAEFFGVLSGLFAFDAIGDYAHVGSLRFITKDHNIIADYHGLTSARISQFTKLFENNYPWRALGIIEDAHLIAIGGGYQKGVFPTLGS